MTTRTVDWADVAAVGLVALDWFDDDEHPVRSLLAHDRGAFTCGLSVYQQIADRMASALREAYLVGKASRHDTTHADLCTLLQLDPERATTDDVLALVGGLLDAAGRLDRLRAALADVADASPGTLSQTAAAMRALREDGERAAPPSPWRPVSEELKDWSECALAICAPGRPVACVSLLDAARRSLSSVSESMTEHAYQELASALESPPRIAGKTAGFDQPGREHTVGDALGLRRDR